VSSPSPERSLRDGLRQPVDDLAAGLDDANTGSRKTLADLAADPGQPGLGPTADNDVDLLHRHLAQDMFPGSGSA
jgi:hypothetical protein